MPKQFTQWYFSSALHAEQMFNHALQIQAKLVFTNETVSWNIVKKSRQYLARSGFHSNEEHSGLGEELCDIHMSQYFTE